MSDMHIRCTPTDEQGRFCTHEGREHPAPEDDRCWWHVIALLIDTDLASGMGDDTQNANPCGHVQRHARTVKDKQGPRAETSEHFAHFR